MTNFKVWDTVEVYQCPSGGEQFSIDCYGLTLGSYHMVLGVQWLESLDPIPWHFGWRTLQFIRNGHQVRLSASGTDPVPLSLLQMEGNVMDNILLHFE
jgi:hypothetical protein